ncbi:MAG: hypothetical protein HZA90_00235 [Verrucomicrobia bacterium]|nr:hypothetical protein [Verrucomicrobiota bacterium]
MLNIERKWLEAVPWQTVVNTNQGLCEKDSQPHAPSAKGYDAARKLWEEAAPRDLRLRQVLEMCREIHKLAPFQFFNGNTVAAVAKTFVEDMLQSLPPVQAQIARSTVSHYVVGVIKPRELEDVFAAFDGLWRHGGAAPPK